MDNVSKTLYIPLYGKALVSKKGIILSDPHAEAIWKEEGFTLRGKSASKWLAYYMGMRSSTFDRWTKAQMARDPEAVVLHLGCGMDSRAFRLGDYKNHWYDVDFHEVIAERRRYFRDSEQYHLIPADLRRSEWLQTLPGSNAIVVMEGVSMYLEPRELKKLLTDISNHFAGVKLLVDCYTPFAAKASKYKNPINDVGVSRVWGLDDPANLTGTTGLSFVSEHTMTPEDLIAQLKPMEQAIFRKLYAGTMAQKLYKLYEYTG